MENIYLNAMWESVTFEFVLKFIIVYFFIIWIALIVWVIKDITNRTDNIYHQIISVLIILFLTPFGIFIYLLVRPAKTLYEHYYEEIEENLDIFHDIIEERKKELDQKIIAEKAKIKKNIIKDDKKEDEVLEIINEHKKD